MLPAQLRLLIITLSVTLVAVACGGGSDTTDDSRDAGSTEQDQSTQDQTTQNDAELVADYPQELVLPGSQLTESGTELEASGLRTITVWRISADVEDILSFYEGAFDRLDVLGEPQRVELGDFGSLTFGDADSGPASVTVDTTNDGDRTVTVAYLITAGATTTQPRDDDDSDVTDDGDTASTAASIITSDADDLLLKDDDLPQRTWFSSDSQGLVVEFADATAALFSTVQCQGLDELVFNLEASGPTARDSEARIFRTGGGFNFGRIMTGVAVFNSVADADRAFANSRDVLSGAQIAACFASGVAEAQSEAQRVAASLNASLGDPDFLLQGAAGQQAHIEGGAAGISINVDLQIHTFQRANVVALFSTVISNDAALVAAIPQILCTFEQRVLGSSCPGGQECLESSVA